MTRWLDADVVRRIIAPHMPSSTALGFPRTAAVPSIAALPVLVIVARGVSDGAEPSEAGTWER